MVKSCRTHRQVWLPVCSVKFLKRSVLGFRQWVDGGGGGVPASPSEQHRGCSLDSFLRAGSSTRATLPVFGSLEVCCHPSFRENGRQGIPGLSKWPPRSSDSGGADEHAGELSPSRTGVVPLYAHHSDP